MDQAGNPPIYTPPAPQPAFTAIPGPVPNQQQPGQVVTQQYVITIDANTEPSVASNLRGIGRTAIIQLVCAGASVVAAIVSYIMGILWSSIIIPAFFGLCIFMVAGILGRVALRKKNRCSIVAYMVLSIISSVLAGIMLLEFFMNAIHSLFGGSEQRRSNVIIFDSLTCLVGLVEMITAIVASAYCCKRTCCAPVDRTKIQYAPGVPVGSVPQGQVVMLPPQGQGAMMNPGPQLPSYEAAQAAPLPDKNSMDMQQPTVVQLSAPQPTIGASAPSESGATGPNYGGQDIVVVSDTTEQQPLVEY